MRYAVAIEPGTGAAAWGVIVPDLPGCFSAGDTLEEAMIQAENAIAGWIGIALDDGHAIPAPSCIEALRAAHPGFKCWLWVQVKADPPLPAMKPKPRLGRPSNQSPEVCHSSANASPALVDEYKKRVIAVMSSYEAPRAFFAHLDVCALDLLAFDLAHEVAFYPAMRGLVKSSHKSTSGPKPKVAQALFLTQVRVILLRRGVALPQWANARARCDDLVDFCGLLLGVSGTQDGVISDRTARVAPVDGWTAPPL